jgi:hypothetical protein
MAQLTAVQQTSRPAQASILGVEILPQPFPLWAVMVQLVSAEVPRVADGSRQPRRAAEAVQFLQHDWRDQCWRVSTRLSNTQFRYCMPIPGLIAVLLGRLKVSVADRIATYLSRSAHVFRETRHRVTAKGQT